MIEIPRLRALLPLAAALAVAAASPGQTPVKGDDRWTQDFRVAPEEWTSTGRNPFFILEPGYTLVLEGGATKLAITVLRETRRIAGVATRIVEERESEGDRLVEVSRNFMAMSRRTSGVYYFGEDVDVYERDGRLTHQGAWRAGEGGARFGLIMPGEPLLGARHYQEIAPGVAMDRAEVVDLHARVTTPAGVFTDCLVVEETTPLEPDARERKVYARGVGLVQDGELRLIRYSR
jgi:hypothetical protein